MATIDALNHQFAITNFAQFEVEQRRLPRWGTNSKGMAGEIVAGMATSAGSTVSHRLKK